MKKEEYLEIRKKLHKLISGTKFAEHTYCVGGCVRDFVLEREIKDIDLVVSLEGGGFDLAQYLYDSGALLYEPVIYENFGTAQFRLLDFPEHEIEAVQTRSEEYIDRKSRNPRTGFGTFIDDWKRRDFTVNTLYQKIGENDIIKDPSLLSLSDIKAKIIRTTSPADIIFQDDPLRILRCIRFAVTLGWEIEEKTWKGLENSVERLGIISKERITAEMDKILCSPDPAQGLELLKESGALKFISPYLQECTEMTQNKYHIGTVWEHTVEVVKKCAGNLRLVMWAALLHDIGKLRTKTEDSRGVHFIGHAEEGAKMCEEILRDLKFSVDDIKKIQILVGRHMYFKSYAPGIPKDKRLRKLQYEIGEELYWMLLDLVEADNMSHAQGYCIPGQIDKIVERTKEMTTLFSYKLPVSGADIMEVRKIGPGKLVKGYQDYLMKLVFNNPRLTKEQLLRMIKNVGPDKLGKEYENL